MEIHAVAGVIVKDGRLLVVKEFDEEVYHTPGGKIELPETPMDALKRELEEEIGVQLLSAQPFIKINDETFHGDKLLLETFMAEIEGMPKPSSEIESLQWIGKMGEDENIKLTIPSQKQLLKLIEMNLIE